MPLNISLVYEPSEKQSPPLCLEIRQNILIEEDIKLGPVQDLREKLEEMEKPWLSPGVDVKDYFNYGLNEQTFQMHQEKLRLLRIFSEFLGRKKDGDKNKRVKVDANFKDTNRSQYGRRNQFGTIGYNSNKPQYDGRRYNDSQYDGRRYNDSQYDGRRYNDSQYERGRYNEPQYDDRRYNEPQYDDRRYNEPQYDDRRYKDRQHERRRYEQSNQFHNGIQHNRYPNNPQINQERQPYHKPHSRRQPPRNNTSPKEPEKHKNNTSQKEPEKQKKL